MYQSVNSINNHFKFELNIHMQQRLMLVCIFQRELWVLSELWVLLALVGCGFCGSCGFVGFVGSVCCGFCGFWQEYIRLCRLLVGVSQLAAIKLGASQLL